MKLTIECPDCRAHAAGTTMLLPICTSVAIERGVAPAEIVASYLSDYHARDHVDRVTGAPMPAAVT